MYLSLYHTSFVWINTLYHNDARDHDNDGHSVWKKLERENDDDELMVEEERAEKE